LSYCDLRLEPIDIILPDREVKIPAKK
jgi:hypothetical protein